METWRDLLDGIYIYAIPEQERMLMSANQIIPKLAQPMNELLVSMMKLPTLKLTARSHLEMDAWKYGPFLLAI